MGPIFIVNDFFFFTTVDEPTGTNLDHQFPESDFYVEGKRLLDERCITENCCGFETKVHTFSFHIEHEFNLFLQGATEYGCIHSVNMLGLIYAGPIFNQVYCAQPWCIEGAIHGSLNCTVQLLENYFKAKPYTPVALTMFNVLDENDIQVF